MLRKTAQAILNALDCPDGELSVSIVDDAEIEIINREYRNRPHPTNVIAFSMREGAFSALNPDLLGDVIISTQTCGQEAKAAGIRFEERFEELLIHGILHLFGYDHEQSTEAEERMWHKTRELLEIIRRPAIEGHVPGRTPTDNRGDSNP